MTKRCKFYAGYNSRGKEALKEAEITYRDLLDNTNDLIQSVKPDDHFRYVNDAWRKSLGYS